MRTALNILATLVMLAFISISIYFIYDDYNTSKINKDLKKELYELKQKLAECKEERNKISFEKSDLFDAYIDLGIKCGANE